MSITECPALLVAAAASGTGKTSLTAALARLYTQKGKKVRVFKAGPDFIDPGVHERASGVPVYQLDLWMVGETECRRLLAEASGQADMILIEGVMGLFDGTPSSADLAEKFGIPVLAVIDASAQAQTFGAIAYGLAKYRSTVPFAGVVANRVASDRHVDMLKSSLPSDIPWLGSLGRDPDGALPERHLGLVGAHELPDLDARLDRLASALQLNEDWQFPVVKFSSSEKVAVPKLLQGITIAIARDDAFAFIYRANLDLLVGMGAQLRFFSPIADTELPAADAYYLPGGYPELHLEVLSANTGFRQGLQDACSAGKPIVAECGGMMALFDGITDASGNRFAMWGLLPGEVSMQSRLGGLGMQAVSLPEGTLRGHTFHYSRVETPLTPIATAMRQSGSEGEAVYRLHRLTASYLHAYWPSNPEAVAKLFLP